MFCGSTSKYTRLAMGLWLVSNILQSTDVLEHGMRSRAGVAEIPSDFNVLTIYLCFLQTTFSSRAALVESSFG